MLGDAHKSSVSHLKAQIDTYHRDLSCTQTISRSLRQNFAYSVVKTGRMFSKTVIFISGDIFDSRAELTARAYTPGPECCGAHGVLCIHAL